MDLFPTILKEVFMEIVKQKSLSQSMSQAIITVVHKKIEENVSYRPVSFQMITRY